MATNRNPDFSKLKGKKFEEVAFITNSFLSLNNLSKELENINIPPQQTIEDETKNSLFITAEEKSNGEYSSFLYANNKKKKKQFSTDELSFSSSRQGMLPRIKQSVNN